MKSGGKFIVKESGESLETEARLCISVVYENLACCIC